MRAHLRYLILGLSLLFFAPILNVGAVNINKADAETLQRRLQGIGPVKSQATVDYRKKQGPYINLNDLLKVEDIGPKLLEKNDNSLSLNRGVSKTEKVEKPLCGSKPNNRQVPRNHQRRSRQKTT